MTIYVDHAVWHYKGRRWCHMMTDGQLSELHEFAAKIGLNGSWFQNPRGKEHPHYDLTVNMRAKAIANGAQVLESVEMVKRCVLAKRVKNGG